MWLLPGQAASAPWIARWLDSVPFEVKTISAGVALSSRATDARASPTFSFAASPNACLLDGLPQVSRRHSSTGARHSGATVVVALLSR